MRFSILLFALPAVAAYMCAPGEEAIVPNTTNTRETAMQQIENAIYNANMDRSTTIMGVENITPGRLPSLRGELQVLIDDFYDKNRDWVLALENLINFVGDPELFMVEAEEPVPEDEEEDGE